MAALVPHISTNPEYQHFVPQFMLRNFAHKYTGPPQRSNKKGKKKKDDKSIYRGELVVNNVNLQTDPVAIEETKVSRILGNYDMYQDTTGQNAAQQRQIEAMLGKLEGQTSIIFRKITKAFEAKESGVWVTRDERNAIRKFLFILKYRGSTFFRRFNHNSAETYEANDKDKFLAYMKEHNFKRPIDVWFHGLRTIMELKMDNGVWHQELVKKMYPDDAMWFFMHSEMMYMSICTPEQAENEFILMDNSYNIFEGPNTFVQDPLTGQVHQSGWTNFHEFAPLSPQLMIVLRSNLLPNPEEDSDPSVRANREAMLRQTVDDYYGKSQPSRLADLPVRKPRNSYSRIVNGRIEGLPGASDQKRATDRFCFEFFPLGTDHVDRINHIFLDNARTCRNIVFCSRGVLAGTLARYIGDPLAFVRVAAGDAPEERRRILFGLAELAKTLSPSAPEPAWIGERDKPLPQLLQLDPDAGLKFKELQSMQKKAQDSLVDWMNEGKKQLSENPQLARGQRYSFMTLGGTNETFIEDLERTRYMMDRRIKIDVRSQGEPEDVRHRRREQLIEEYLNYPPRHVFLFAGRIRMMVLSKQDPEYLKRQPDTNAENPEDIIARTLYGMIPDKNLNRLMYKAAMVDVERLTLPWDALGSTPASVQDAFSDCFSAVHTLQKCVLGIPGLIKECGIPEIEKLAISQERRILQHGLDNIGEVPMLFIDEDQELEIWTRVMVKPKFREALAGTQADKSGLLQELEQVLFEITYSTLDLEPPF